MWHIRCLAVVTFVVACICLSVAQLECKKYPICADSMFKKPTPIETRYNNSFIDSVILLQRFSYYKCDPAVKKYGISRDSKEWWLFLGCGGIFEVNECSERPKQRLIPKPADQIKSHDKEYDRKCREQLGLNKEQKKDTKGF